MRSLVCKPTRTTTGLSLALARAGSSSSTCSPFQASGDAEAGLYWRSIAHQSGEEPTSVIGD